MLRRCTGTLVLLTTALLLVTCELTPGGPAVTTLSTPPTEAAPASPPSPFPISPSPSIAPTPAPTSEPLVASPLSAAATTGPPMVEVPADDFEAVIVGETNQYRQEAGCPPVSVDPRLTVAAQAHAEDMALNDFFSHAGSDGSSLAGRVEAVDYPYRLVGENIAAGFASAVDVVNSWMQSEEHRNNILNCEFKDIGVGYTFLQDDPGNETWQYYWVQVFGVKSD